MGGTSSSVNNSIISSAASSLPLFPTPIQKHTQTFAELLTDAVVAIEELSAAIFKVVAAVLHLCNALGKISYALIINSWLFLEPIATFIGHLETSTRWSVLSCVFFLALGLFLHRRGTLSRFANLIRLLRRQILSTIPCISVLIFFDIIPRFYLTSYVYRWLHLILCFAVPTTFSAIAVAENYFISRWCPESTPRETTGKKNSPNMTIESQHSLSSAGLIQIRRTKTTTPREISKVDPEYPTFHQSYLKDNPKYISTASGVIMPPLAVSAANLPKSSFATTMDLDSYSTAEICLLPSSRTQLPLWLEYWVVVNLLRLFLSVVPSIVAKTIRCASIANSPLDEFSLLKPLEHSTCPAVAVRALVVFSCLHTLMEFGNVLLVVAVRQESSEILHPILDYFGRTIESLVELFTGLKIITTSSNENSSSITQNWLAPFLYTWKGVILCYMPTKLLWASRIILKLPHACLLFMPALFLRPVILIVGTIFPAISAMRELESHNRSKYGKVDGVSKWVAYFLLLGVTQAAWSLINFFTCDSVPCVVHLQYITVLAIQLLAASPEALEHVCTNITTAALALTPRGSGTETAGGMDTAASTSRHMPSYVMHLNGSSHRSRERIDDDRVSPKSNFISPKTLHSTQSHHASQTYPTPNSTTTSSSSSGGEDDCDDNASTGGIDTIGCGTRIPLLATPPHKSFAAVLPSDTNMPPWAKLGSQSSFSVTSSTEASSLTGGINTTTNSNSTTESKYQEHRNSLSSNLPNFGFCDDDTTGKASEEMSPVFAPVDDPEVNTGKTSEGVALLQSLSSAVY